jgi:hypothetical protein
MWPWPYRSGENHQKDDQLDRDERRDDEEDCEQMLIDEPHVREVVARIASPLHFPAKGNVTRRERWLRHPRQDTAHQRFLCEQLAKHGKHDGTDRLLLAALVVFN